MALSSIDKQTTKVAWKKTTRKQKSPLAAGFKWL